jgi:hypothetical protein
MPLGDEGYTIYDPPMTEVKILKKKSYLAMVRNSVAGQMYIFRNVYALVDGEEMDITGNGNWSCAFFVSAVLYINKLIKDMHTGVAGLERDLQASGWMQVTEPKEGAIIVWAPEKGTFVPGLGEMHSHLGFYVGNEKAISNSSNALGIPREHHYTYEGKRRIERIWWHPGLGEI